MFLTENLGINELGNLTVGGIDTTELVKAYKTPLYVMDEVLIRQNCKSFKSSIDRFYNSNGLVCYACKAFCCKEICRIMHDEGMGLDVVSGGELFTAISVGFPTSRICFHGNNKSEDELTLAVRYGVDRIVVDNFTELERLSQLASKLHKSVGIMLRIKPGIDAHTHEFIKTGQIDSKFGFALETGEAFEAVKLAISAENLDLRGIHCHIGSQIFDIQPFQHAAHIMLKLMAKIKRELSFEIRELNLGGGFGIKYTQEDNPPLYDAYMEKVSETVFATCKALDITPPFIIIEPGRSIVGQAGMTLYKIGSVKNIPEIRTYVSVDGGMCDNPRYALYKAKYEMAIADKASQPKDFKATIAGRCCESGDLLGEDVFIQTPEADDILAVFSTGAYNYSMASHYNRIPAPAVVMLNNGKIKLAVKRESNDDVMKNDL
jgi:diaminopimelate decarboxylase